ncbi:diaminopimelate epimerase [Ascidiimonas sp. W6]|uniref:diaminopimelate epimerase n=1 Tax=Ascidiimonas meishanensis TaxID=3128903 RepID=UPI0030EECD59
MLLPFYKYQGTGNDFVIIDNRTLFFPKDDTKLINHLCDRKFGIGGDGLILLENDKISDFRMVYYNSDGQQSTMCGNGGRCIVAFANHLGIIQEHTSFVAIDGLHHAEYGSGVVKLQMGDVQEVAHFEEYSFLNTGSPHHVQLIDNLEKKDIKKLGAAIRYGKYGTSGSNINFVEQLSKNEFVVRTYERGVEDETLSCGTGVTAVALAMFDKHLATSNTIVLKTPGGALEVNFKKTAAGFSNIFLKGPAQMVFKGEIEC